MKWNTRNTPSAAKWHYVRRLDETVHGTHRDGERVRPAREGRLAAPIVVVEVDANGNIIPRN